MGAPFCYYLIYRQTSARGGGVNVTDETFWKVVAACAGGAATTIGAAIAYAGVKAANALRNRELVIKALELLTGGTQNRTVGIALISELIDNKGIRSETAKIILEGQAAHLEDENNANRNRPIELKNLATIKELLNKLPKPALKAKKP
jgi:hypothetical protein